ncbi:melanocortin receptor 5-like [Clytia hemisphaerica]|uniref:melanocortin receptor 5-like n=1 Tax=Clytia hemisphaerica TaxID=252671 RepID=UPI0034D4A325
MNQSVSKSPSFTNSNFTSTSKFVNCYSNYDNIVYVSNPARYILVACYVIMIVVNTMLNSLSSFVNVLTGHYKKRSLRMVFIISVCDILQAVIASITQIIFILYIEHLACSQRRMLLLFPHIFIYQSCYLVMFMALDRFLHVMLLSRYTTIITATRHNLLFAVYVFFALYSAVITTFGPALFGQNGGARYSTPANLLFIGSAFVLYILSIIKLRSHRKRSKRISASTTSMTKLASAFLILVTICYAPIILFLPVMKPFERKFGKSSSILLMYALLLLSNLNSTGNALVYMTTNGRARRKLKEVLMCWRKNKIGESKAAEHKENPTQSTETSAC